MIRVGCAVLALLVAAGCTGPPAEHRPASGGSAPAGSAPPDPWPAASAAPTGPATPSPAPLRSGSSAARPSAAAATPSPVPPVPAAARSAGLLDIRTVVPDAVVDLRYASKDNFTGVKLYPADARCLVHESMAAGLRVAADRLRRQGYLLVFWDCYRPHPVQVRMFRLVPDPSWVARPGPYARSHEAGRSVDVTLARTGSHACPAAQRSHGQCLVDMGTGFDDFSPRAHAYAIDGISAPARQHRNTLRSAMNAGGISVYSGEWWHFDGPGAKVGRPNLDVPLD